MSAEGQEATFVDYDIAVIANRATTNAGGMTTIPSFRNCHAVTASPSRLKAISHRIVASEPVTERLGPRSTPINIPLVTCRGTLALWLTVAATKPVGRLFIRFEAKATMMPAPKEASRGEYAATSRSICVAEFKIPICATPATNMNSPATSGNTPHEISRNTGSGDRRLVN